MKKINKYIKAIEKKIVNPKKSLPEEVFLFISRLTPLVNVDLLIKNEKNEFLLTWRVDKNYYLPGWHLPGGIVRLGETLQDRIKEVAKRELGTQVSASLEPLTMTEFILPKWKNRSHGIAFLYECILTSSLDETKRFKGGNLQNGQWACHKTCPDNLIAIQNVYQKFLKGEN